MVQRVGKDRSKRDYTGQSLDLRNNPWFFSKEYTQQPLVDDEDFYFLIETKVGSSKQLRMKLQGESQLLKECQSKEDTQPKAKGKKFQQRGDRGRHDKKDAHN